MPIHINSPGSIDLSTSTPTLKKRIIDLTTNAGIDPKLTEYIFQHESNFDPNEVGDMYIICPKTGRPVRARGVAQITECYHPEITDTQALDPIWSTKWSIPYMKNKKICMNMWSTCRDYYSKSV